MGDNTKTDEPSEKFQTAFDPPYPYPHFWIWSCFIFLQFHAQKLYLQNVQHKFLDWKWPPPLQLFRKFICFRVSSPVPKYNNIFQMIWLG